MKNNQDKNIYTVYKEQPCIKSPQSYCICKQLCVSRLVFANRERKISPLVVDDLINGQPSRCARLMMHVNLEGILACLITCCSEIVGVSCTDIYISILTSVITVCALFPLLAETNMEVGFAFFLLLKPKDEGTKLHSAYAALINTLNVINQQHGGKWVSPGTVL